jgi:hypothetical protein
LQIIANVIYTHHYPRNKFMSEHYGSCLCGNVKFTIEGDFDNFYLCHCSYCQKDTGSAHAANLFSRSATLSWQAGEDAVNTFTLPGTRHRRSFCVRCGSALPSMQMAGKLLVVPAGCLDSKLTVRPDAHLFTSSRATWDSSLETLPKFDALPE